jgi:hypothetical protein
MVPRIGPERFRRAVPHLIGAYAVAGLLTAASAYNRFPALPLGHNERMTMAVQSGTMWPLYWAAKAVHKAYRAISPSARFPGEPAHPGASVTNG